MVSKLGHRLLIVGSIILGGLAWWCIYPYLLAGDANGGISLFQTHIGFIPAVFLVIIAGIPAMVLGILVSGTGKTLSGIFTVCISLLFLAGAGGGIQGVFWRSHLPGEFLWLILETLVWTAGIIGMMTLIALAGRWLRHRLTGEQADRHLKREPGEPGGPGVGLPDAQSLIAGLVATAIGLLLVWALMRAPNEGQAVGSLLLSFTIAGLLAATIMPTSNPIAILLSPMLVALIGYVYSYLYFSNNDQVLAAYYARTLPGVAIVLPIFYASAGVAGAAFGVMITQAIEGVRLPLEDENSHMQTQIKSSI